MAVNLLILQCKLILTINSIFPSIIKLKIMLKIGRQIILTSNLLLASSRHLILSPLQFYFATKTVSLPFLAESITEGTIGLFIRKEGEWVNQDGVVASIETSKVTVEIRSPTDGLVTKLYAKAGDKVEVGRPLFDVDPDASKPPTTQNAKKPVEKTEATKAEKTKPDTLKQAPKIKNIKQKQKQVIEPQSIKQKQKQVIESPTIKQSKKQVVESSLSSTSNTQRVQTRTSMSRLRMRVSQRLKQSQNTYAMLTTFQEVDMSEAQKSRKQLGEDFMNKYSIKLGYMSFFLKAATLALQEYPAVNSTIDKEEIIKRNFIDISIAVSTPKGLLVPVLRDCQKMKFHDFQLGLANLAKKGNEGKILVEDMQGGTFTISNGGVFGSLMGTPIINPPQSAILGLHSIINRPVVRGDVVVARPMMYLALTYDHRLLDGKDAVLFLKKIQSLVQNPRRMLLEV